MPATGNKPNAPAIRAITRNKRAKRNMGILLPVIGNWQLSNYVLLVRYFFLPFLDGTLAPFFRASDRPIAIACLRLLTFLPERPLLSLPRLRLCIALFTNCRALVAYLVA